jgi:hypothetical protein
MWSSDDWTAGLLPFDAQARIPLAVQQHVPADANPAAARRKRTVFRCIGRQLMEYHRYRLSGVRLQRRVWTTDRSVVTGCIGGGVHDERVLTAVRHSTDGCSRTGALPAWIECGTSFSRASALAALDGGGWRLTPHLRLLHYCAPGDADRREAYPFITSVEFKTERIPSASQGLSRFHGKMVTRIFGQSRGRASTTAVARGHAQPSTSPVSPYGVRGRRSFSSLAVHA